MPKFLDSTEKIKEYISTLEKDVLVLSNMFFRDYKCPSHCGGCCPRFSLDYVKSSERWEKFKQIYPNEVYRFKERVVDGQVFMSDTQEDHKDYHCRNLNKENGRCMIHESNPFSCEFELMKITTMGAYKRVVGLDSHAVIIKKLFGRGWAMKRIDGERGALCEMTGFNYDAFLRDIKLLKELRTIMVGFGKKNKKLDLLIKHLDENKELYKTNRREFDDRMNTIVITEDDGIITMQQLKEKVN